MKHRFWKILLAFYVGNTYLYSQQDTLAIQRNFSDDFQEKYQDKDFIYEQKKHTANWWDQLVESITRFIQDLFRIKDPKQAQDTVDIILKTLAVFIILFVVYKIIQLVLNKEGQWIFGSAKNQNVLQVEDVAVNVHQINFAKAIEQSLQQNDYRLAIRYYYLWTLKKLSNSNQIKWDPEKTNADYAYELQNSALKHDFEYHSYLYDYAWYGGFEISKEHFSQAKNSFEKFLKNIR
ncbi:MAG: DUF4129 domain-containing protein [Flavobacterium sp.]